MCVSLRDLYYSPLCDTDFKAYSAYLDRLDNCRRYGQFAQQLECFHGPRCVQGRDSCDDDIGSCVDSKFLVSAEKKVNAAVDDKSDFTLSFGQLDFVYCGLKGQQSSRKGACGMAIGYASESGDNISGDVCFGSKSSCVQDTENRNGSLESSLNLSKGEHGPNWERNRRNRLEKKNKKKKRQQIGQDWRVRNRDKVDDRRGFFRDCEESVRKDLCESRAKLLIAENKRKFLDEERKIQRASSPQSLVQEMIRVTNMANRLTRQTSDHEIGGWAKTVADSLTRSVAENAPSSVPSLESVGYGKSALRSSNGDEDSKISLKRIEYETMIASVHAKYDQMDYVVQDDLDDELRHIKNLYSDVAFSEAELEKRKTLQEAAGYLISQGIEAQKIDIAFAEFGIDFDY